MGDKETDGNLGEVWCLRGGQAPGRVKQALQVLLIRISWVHMHVVGERYSGEESMCSRSLEGWGQIKQGEEGERQAEWRELSKWKPDNVEKA